MPLSELLKLVIDCAKFLPTIDTYGALLLNFGRQRSGRIQASHLFDLPDSFLQLCNALTLAGKDADSQVSNPLRDLLPQNIQRTL